MAEFTLPYMYAEDDCPCCGDHWGDCICPSECDVCELEADDTEGEISDE